MSEHLAVPLFEQAGIICSYPGCVVTTELQACSRCKIQRYCSRVHQKLDWKEHKKKCIPVGGENNSSSNTGSKNIKQPEPSKLKPSRTSAAEGSIQMYTLAEMPTDLEPVYKQGWSLKVAYGMLDRGLVGFFNALEADAYPVHDTEGFYGIQMNPPNEIINGKRVKSIGNLVYLAWLQLWTFMFEDKAKTRMEICFSMLDGRFPIWLEGEIRQLAQSKYNNVYVEELMSRGLENIKYDPMLFRFVWGPLSEEDVVHIFGV